MLQAALAYARLGLRVHPCRPADKRPYVRWSTEASTDPDVIAGWWKHWPDALIAVCTGRGLVVVDDDRGLAHPDGDLAQTLTARTRSRGFHHWFTSSEPVGCAVGLVPGIDIRGEGGYVIAPPSPGWEWLNWGDVEYVTTPMLSLPAWIVEAFNARTTAARRFSGGFEPSERVAEGGRNDYMARFAGYAIRVGIDDELELVELCLEHNAQVCVPPLDDREVKTTARSILRRHNRSGRA